MDMSYFILIGSRLSFLIFGLCLFCMDQELSQGGSLESYIKRAHKPQAIGGQSERENVLLLYSFCVCLFVCAPRGGRFGEFRSIQGGIQVSYFFFISCFCSFQDFLDFSCFIFIIFVSILVVEYFIHLIYSVLCLYSIFCMYAHLPNFFYPSISLSCLFIILLICVNMC